MKVFVILSAFLAAAQCRPDIGLALKGGVHVPSGSYIPSEPSKNFQAPDLGYQYSGAGLTDVRINLGTAHDHVSHGSHGSHEVSHGSGGFSHGVSHESHGSLPLQTGFSHGSGSSYEASQFGHSHTKTVINQNQVPNLPAQVLKHTYFFEAPEDHEELRTRINVPVRAPKKHVNIIFVKAPSYASSAARIVAPQQQDEQKTIVYVLVKKPEADSAEINLDSAPKPVSKPEVFFIKYKTKQEAEAKIAESLKGSNSGVDFATTLNNEHDLVHSISKDDSHVNHEVNVNYVATQDNAGGSDVYRDNTGGSNTYQGTSNVFVSNNNIPAQPTSSSGDVVVNYVSTGNDGSFTLQGGSSVGTVQSDHHHHSTAVPATNYGPVGISGPYKK